LCTCGGGGLSAQRFDRGVRSLGETKRKPFLDVFRDDPVVAGRCLSLTAVSVAPSFIVHPGHADNLSASIRCAEQHDRAALTWLAIIMGWDDACTTIVRLLHANPRHTVDIVAGVPWNNVHANARTIILFATDSHDVCAAIAFSRGDRTAPSAITSVTARAFFAAVTPTVWTTWMVRRFRRMERASRRTVAQSRSRIPGTYRARQHPDPPVHRYVRDVDAVRWTLLLSESSSDPVAFDVRDVDAVRWTLLPIAVRNLTLAALRVAARSPSAALAARCAAKAAAFVGWLSKEGTAFLATLPNDVVTALRPSQRADECTGAS